MLKQKPASKGTSNTHIIGGKSWATLKREKAALVKKHPDTFNAAVEECETWWDAEWDSWPYEDQVDAVLAVSERMLENNG